MKIKHLLDENEKVTIFVNDADFIRFVKRIRDENEDSEVGFDINTKQGAINYITEYCDNLELIL